MRVSVKCLVTSFMILALMAGAAFAGTARVNFGGAANTTFAISAETLGVARDVVITSSANAFSAVNVAMSYVLTQNMTTQNLLQVSLANAAFNGSVLYVCAPNIDPTAGAANVFRIGTGTPTAGATSFNFQAAAPVNSGSFVFLTSTPCPETIGAAAINANMPLRIPAFGTTGFGTVTMGTVTAGNISVDPSSTTNAVNIVREYAVVLTTRNMIIDYLNANLDGPGNGTTFVQGASSNIRRTNGAQNVFEVNRTNTNFTVANAGLTPGFQTTTNTTTDWTGVTDVFLANGAINCAANLGAVSTSPSGAVINTAAYPGAAANAYDLCMNVNGTTELTPRTITGTYGVTVPGGNPATAATGNFQVWTLNAFQAYVPHMRWDTADNTRTFVRFVNRDTRAIDAQVAVQLNGEAPTTYTLGSVPARGIVTYSARTIAEDHGIDHDNYAALFTVKTSQNNVHAEAFFNLVGFGTRNTTLYEIEGNKTYNMK